MTVLALGAVAPAFADRHDVDDLQLWTPVVLELPVNERVETWVQLENRMANNLRDAASALRAIGGVNYQLTSSLSTGAAYGWYPDVEPRYEWEQRFWQHVTWTRKIRNLELTLRQRLEQRIIQDADNPSIRTRGMVRVDVPIKDTPWYWAAYEEAFFTLSDNNSDPRQGFDQNRLFTGFGRRIGENTNVEAGYIFQIVNEPNDDVDEHNHIIMIRVSHKLGMLLRPD